MVAHSAEAIFAEFRRLRDGNDMQTAEERLESYCRDVLTSVEGVHFDYKCKQDSRTPQLEESDKRNLAKALSGFANSGGGVLLWGIKEGLPPKLRPIAQIQTFLKNLLELGGLATDPAVPGLQGHWLPSKHDPSAGFAAILVPESPLPPHRIALKIKEVQHHYYIRTGSDFVIASHSQLEDMFGRRPRPKLVAVARGDFPFAPPPPQWQIAFDVVNEGRGTAKQVCIEFSLLSGMSPKDGYDWRHVGGTRDATTGHESLVFELVPLRVIHPGMAMHFSGLYLNRSHFASGEYVRLVCTLYCEGCAPVRTSIEGSLQPIRDRAGPA
jgi:hypothetical protein